MPEAITSSVQGKPEASILIRGALSSDLAQIAALGSATFSATFGYSMPPNDLTTYLIEAYSSEAMAKDHADPNLSTLVAVPADEPEKVVGFSQLRRGTTEACLAGVPRLVELQRLYVHSEWHGRGIGTLLIQSIEQLAKKEGWGNLWLGVWEENFKAQRMYAKFGFNKVGDHDFVMGECVQTDWILCKSL